MRPRSTPTAALAVEQLAATAAILDGEIFAIDDTPAPNIEQALG
jgi:hypothetical protein